MYKFSHLEAVKNLQLYMGLGVCERTDRIPDGKASHVLFMTGMYRGGVDVAARAKLALAADGTVNMCLAVRAGEAEVAEIVASAIG